MATSRSARTDSNDTPKTGHQVASLLAHNAVDTTTPNEEDPR